MTAASSGRRSLPSEPLFASKRVARLARQCQVALLLVLLATLPFTYMTPAFEVPRPVLLIIHLLGAAGVSLAVGLRSHHHRKAVYLSTTCLFVVMAAHLLNSGLRYAGSVLVMMVAPMLLLGLEHRRAGVLFATALALLATAVAALLELNHALAGPTPELREMYGLLRVRGAFVTLALLTLGFLVDRVLAILRHREVFLAGVLDNIDQAERKLRFQADVLASINDAVIAIDSAGLITYMNRAAERLYAQPPGGGIGCALELLAGAEFQRAALADAQLDPAKLPVRSSSFLRSDQVHVPIEYTVSTLRGEGGETTGTLAVIRDVTERRALQDQLLAAQKQEALGRLAGGVAHDFNNLLVVIRGSAEFVHADLPPDHLSQPDLLEVMRAADRAAGLVRQLLTFARRQPPSLRSVALDKVLRDLLHMLRRLIREEIQLLIDIASDLWSVKVDVAQIEQVIVNLLVNARDAIPHEGRITLEVRNAQLEGAQADALAVPAGDYVLLRVRDSGTGMDAETKKRIFEPFFSTKKTGAGTGLGLAVCEGIIKQLGGGIMAESVIGQGTAFTIALPRSHEVPRSTSAPHHIELPGGTETILVVEDDNAVRELAVRVLRTQGYRVHEAADGAAALRRVAELDGEPLDLLFADVILPRMGGQELARDLMERRPGLAVLLASGYGDSGPAPGVLGDSVWAFLAKPYGPAALLQRVRAVLDAAAGRARAKQAAERFL